MCNDQGENRLMIKNFLIIISLFLVIYPRSSKVNADDLCHPTVSENSENFIIGYGSLIETKSRKLTNPNANNAYPIMINGFQRLWGVDAGNYKGTFLTVIRKPDQFFNAVYYQVQENDIRNTDEREVGYCRTKINVSNLKPMGLETLPKGNYWIYTINPNNLSSPSEEYPIIQSYVDIFISGCFQIQKRYQN